MRHAIGAVVALGLWPGAGLAGLEICNDTDARQSVAVGHKRGGEWTSEGWWNIAPGACAEPVKGDLTNRYYYYRAEAAGAGFEDDGVFFCTEREAFTIAGQDGCAERGHAREGFRKIDTGQTARHFTLRLAESGPKAGAEAAAAAPAAPQAWESGLAQGQAGEPFTETARFQGCDVIDGARYCAFHAAGWKWYAWYGGPTPEAFLERLQGLPVGSYVEIAGDIVNYGDISVEMALSRVTPRPGAAPHQAWFEALQGAWVSVDDPAYRIEVVGSEMFETHAGGGDALYFWRFAEGCDDAPPEAGPVLLKTEPETQESQCYLPDRIGAATWEMFYAGRGNLLRFRRP